MTLSVAPDCLPPVARRLEGLVHRTPVCTSGALDAQLGLRLFCKCENLQKVGAFKFRGASNAILSLSDTEARRGVVTHSSGNHAQALALAARGRGIPATVVMPSTSARVKVEAVAGYGARIVTCEPTLEARESTAREIVEHTGATLIHAYDHPEVIAGQGTAALELLQEVPALDLIIAPVGGGGLLSGTALAALLASPRTRVVGAEPEGADDACRSLAAGRIIPSVDPRTIADGLLTSLGQHTWPIIQRHVHEIITVSDEEIIQAMRDIWERMKLVVEPSAAVSLAALRRRQRDLAGSRVGLILSGGNVDLDRLPWVGPVACGQAAHATDQGTTRQRPSR